MGMPLRKIYEGRCSDGVINIPHEMKGKYIEIYVITKGPIPENIAGTMIALSEERKEELREIKTEMQGKTIPGTKCKTNHITFDIVLERLIMIYRLMKKLE
jgi:hypothetical protein